MSNLSSNGLSRVLTYLKTWITGLLNSKSDTSHTHTKSAITDFPAYGNTAGTICQGNDSRLSDARSPNFANSTWYNVGDDVKIGDHDVGGALGICGQNDNTRIDFCQFNNAGNYKSITYDGTTLYMNGNCDYATSAGAVGTYVNAGSVKALVQCTMGENDAFRIMAGGATNEGWVEIATGDDANEPIYVRQYTYGDSDPFHSLARTLTLLDGSGNTILPGRITLQGNYQLYVG